MANVQVDASANLDQGNRVSIRSGNDFVYVFVNDAGTIRAYKGNIAGEPASFAEQDGGGGNQPSDTDFQNVAVAIKSNGIVSVIWYDNDSAIHGANEALMHAEFSTESAAANQDTWSLAPEDIATLTNADATFAVKENPAIAIDANDDEHVSWTDVVADMGTDKTTLFYSNKISGSWKARIQIRQLIGIVDSDIDIMIAQPTSAIGADRPIIISTRPGSSSHMQAAHGDALDATTFTTTNKTIDPNIPASVNERVHSAAIDSNGKITVVYVEITTLDLKIIEHLASNGWTTWETVVTIDSARDYSSPSITINGTDRYIYVESTADNDIRLWKDEGAGFSEETADADLPNVGTFNDVKVKWSNYVNKSPTELDYVFEDSSGAVQYNTFSVAVAGIIQIANEIIDHVESPVSVLGFVQIGNEILDHVDSGLKVLGVVQIGSDILDHVESAISKVELRRIANEILDHVEVPVRVLAIVRIADEVLEHVESALAILPVALVKIADEILDHVESAIKVIVQKGIGIFGRRSLDKIRSMDKG